MQIPSEAIAQAISADQPTCISLTAALRGAALKRAKDFITANLSADLTFQTIASIAAVSGSGLQALFREQEGCGIFELVSGAHLDAARRGLIAGELDIDEASLLAGYAHSANFTTAFKRRFSYTPSHIVYR